MTKFYTHKLTGRKLEMKKRYNQISTMYVLDENENRIEAGLNVMGKTRHETQIVKNENLLEV